jgi:hypothetical protein
LSTVRTYLQCVVQLKQSFGMKRLGEISPFDLERYKRERLDAGVADNPVAKVNALTESAGRLRYLEPTRKRGSRPKPMSLCAP